MTATTGPTQEQQDTHFMELALRQAEAAVSAGQTPFGAVAVDQRGSVVGQVAFKRVVFAARGTDVPTYKPRLGADLSEAAAWVNTQAGTVGGGGRLHAEPCFADDRGIPLGEGASQNRRGPR